jgi:hypothetical protein
MPTSEEPASAFAHEQPQAQPVWQAKHQLGSMDGMPRGRLRRFNAIDGCNRKALTIEADSSLPSRRLMAALQQRHGLARQAAGDSLQHQVGATVTHSEVGQRIGHPIEKTPARSTASGQVMTDALLWRLRGLMGITDLPKPATSFAILR